MFNQLYYKLKLLFQDSTRLVLFHRQKNVNKYVECNQNEDINITEDSQIVCEKKCMSMVNNCTHALFQHFNVLSHGLRLNVIYGTTSSFHSTVKPQVIKLFKIQSASRDGHWTFVLSQNKLKQAYIWLETFSCME